MTLVAYHPEFEYFSGSQSAAKRVDVWRIPFLGTPLPVLREVELPMRRFTSRENLLRWKFKVGVPIDLMDCAVNGDRQGRELLWQSLHEEVEQVSAAQRLAGRDHLTELDRLLWVAKGVAPEPYGLNLSPGVGAPIHVPEVTVDPSWPGIPFKVELKDLQACDPNSASNAPSEVKSSFRDGNDLIVRVDAASKCGRVYAREPFAGWRGESLRLTWAWKSDPADGRVEACECTRHLEFRVFYAPPNVPLIEAKPR